MMYGVGGHVLIFFFFTGIQMPVHVNGELSVDFGSTVDERHGCVMCWGFWSMAKNKVGRSPWWLAYL